MSIFLADESEQVIILKRWIRKKLPLLLLMIFILTGLQQLISWRKERHIHHQEQASMYLAKILDQNPQSKASSQLMATLIKDYPTTTQAAFAKLNNAKKQIQNHHIGQALYTLQEVSKNNSLPVMLKPIVTLRIARLYLANGQPHKAISTLHQLNDPIDIDQKVFYLGLAYHQLKAYKKANDYFTQVKSNPFFIKQAAFYRHQFLSHGPIETVDHT